MGLASLIKGLRQDEVQVAETVPATYAAGARIVMTIVGGPIQIILMGEYLDTALGGATTTIHTLNGVAQSTAVAIDAGGIGSIVVVPTTGLVKVPSALAAPFPSLTAFAGASLGLIAGASALGWSITFGGAAMGAAERVHFFMAYRKLGKLSRVLTT
jgi:hypothetical protein